jgi:hypothetical protein
MAKLLAVSDWLLAKTKATGIGIENPRVFAKATGFSRRRQVFCALSRFSSVLAVWSAMIPWMVARTASICPPILAID